MQSMRIVFWIYICFLSTISFSQKVELTVQTGHSASINDVIFSPFDDFIATAGSDNKIVIWDFASGKQFKVLLGHKQSVNAVAFHPDNELLLSCSDDSTLLVWNYQTGKLINTLKLPYSIPALALNNAGDKVYLGGEELKILSFPGLKEETVSIRPKKSFETIVISKDDTKLLIGGRDEHYGYLVDIKNRIVLKKFHHPIIGGSFDDLNNSVLFCTNSGLAFSFNYSNEKKKSLSTDIMLNTINDILVDSQYVYTADDYGMIRRLEKKKWFQKNVLRGRLGKINSLALSNDKRYLVSAGKNRAAIIWDLKDLRVVRVMKGIVNRVNDISFSKDGKNILIVYEDGSMRNSNLITNSTIVNRLTLNSSILSKIGFFSIVRIVEFNEDYAVLDALYKQSSIDMEGIYDVIQEFKVYWSFKDNLVDIEEKKELNPMYKKYIRDLKIGLYHDNSYFQDSTLRYDRSDSMKISVGGMGRKLHVNPDNGDKFSFNTGHSDLLTSVEINEKYGFVATASWDGMIRFWDIKSRKLLTVFGAFGDGQFVYVDPNGYYFSSKNALKYIGFSLDNKVFSFEQFDLKYNRPDLVVKDLPYFDDFYEEAFEKAYYKRLSKLGIKESEVGVSKDIPEVKIVNDLSKALVGNELTMSLNCLDKKSNLALLHIFVNGVPEFGRFGKPITGKVYNEDYTIKLNPGTNYIQCYATNIKNGSSLKHTYKIEVPKSSVQSDLYIMSIGVSSYEQSNYNLNYASKDARDIKEFFELSKQYNSVHSQLLLDAAATKENISSMSDFFKNAKEDDVVILFVAGHGVLDDELDYYFAPHNMDFVMPSKNGVSFEVFDEILDNTKCRKKIMFLDACHSGEIDKDEVIKNYVADENEEGDLKFRRAGTTIKNIDDVNSFELSRALFADMRINNGSTVISSSGGAEYAIEGELWHNGVFTYTILKGLRDRKADYNKDKKISVSEIQTYVQFEVNKLTAGKQTPTSRVENLNYNFVLDE
jgi:WD40 repeat protein